MSRSRRKNPYCGFTTAQSEKREKRLANRKLRRITNAILQCGSLDEDEILPEIGDVSNVWDWSKDGKMKIDPSSKEMRK